ncbi:MAG: aminopeptidase P family protein [Candidatus Eisenbacteria bacterium]|nr:aminopeptidase P family protein [Candidatus Eisenbacteria bacterium]
MKTLTAQKLAQATELLRAAGIDAWITFVRETAEGGDPVLPLILETPLVWQSALIVTPDRGRVAIVGRYDADPIRASGDWQDVIAYDEGIRGPLLESLERLVPGRTEREIYDFIQGKIDAEGLGYAWSRVGDPIVNIGPDSMIGHGIPSAEIALRPGQILHIDLGVSVHGYCSDMQRCWYMPERAGAGIPGDVSRALDAVNAAVTAGAEALRPGVEGWAVDAAGRATILDRGYPEYAHAIGHQVGRSGHDGGGVLAPRWERLGRLPYLPVRAGEVYTLELGVMVEGRGYLGIEEMAQVSDAGCVWLTARQREVRLLAS